MLLAPTTPGQSQIATTRLVRQELQRQPLLIGSKFGTQQPIYLAPHQTAVHMAVLGGSGSGKSTFIELLLRQQMLAGLGFCYIDPHSDTANNLVAFAAAQKALGNDSLWRKVHIVEIGPKNAVAYDPFAHLPLRSHVTTMEY